MSFILNLVFWTLGFYYFIYGKKDGNALKMLVWVWLMVYGYFIANFWLNLLFGAGLSIFGFII